MSAPTTPPLLPPALFIDTASPHIACGLVTAAATPALWETTEVESGIGLFRATERLLQATRLSLSDVRTIVFCEGPGSLLGIRLTSMALRTWSVLPRPEPLRLFAYRSLEMVAAQLLESGVPRPFCVLTDARRGTWNALVVATDTSTAAPVGTLERWPAGRPFPANLPLYHPEGFPHWQPLPESVVTVPYRPQSVPELVQRHPLLRETAQPDAFLIETPTYRTWSPPTTVPDAAEGPDKVHTTP